MTHKGGSFLNGHFHIIAKDSTGLPYQKWINEIPNDGLIYYRFLFNAERILVTSPKTLAEVLVHKNYDFIKPKQIVEGAGRILGVGVLLAEGDEHKVLLHKTSRTENEMSDDECLEK